MAAKCTRFSSGCGFHRHYRLYLAPLSTLYNTFCSFKSVLLLPSLHYQLKFHFSELFIIPDSLPKFDLQLPPLLCYSHVAELASHPGTIHINFKKRQTVHFREQGKDKGDPATTPPHEQEQLEHSRVRGAKSFPAVPLSLPSGAQSQALPPSLHMSLCPQVPTPACS